MDDPIGFFLTWATYGTWLPGDSRGWVEYRHGWKMPDPVLVLESLARMTEDACRLNSVERQAVEQQVDETCRHRGWVLHAANARTNHVHVVLSAPNTRPKLIRSNLKAWTTRALKCSHELSRNRENWWAERGSIRWLWNDNDLENAVAYVKDGQDKSPVHCAPRRADA